MLTVGTPFLVFPRHLQHQSAVACQHFGWDLFFEFLLLLWIDTNHVSQSIEMRQVSFQPPGVRLPLRSPGHHDGFKRLLVPQLKTNILGFL